MTLNILEGKWKQLKGEAKQQWSRLTDDDLDFIGGSADKLAGKLQEAYGYDKEEARSKVKAWLDSQL